MAYFDWNSNLLTGSQVIDYQHKRLVGLINDLYEIHEKEDFKEELIEVVFLELKQYAQFHFATEEKILEQSNHADFSDHKKLHRGFEDKLDTLISERDKYDTIKDELFEFLKDWLEHHILVEDKKVIDLHLSGVGLI